MSSSAAPPEPGLSRAMRAACGGVLAVALAFRLYALDRLPGINGDEAWYGVQAQRLAAGTLTHWRTPSGNLPGPLHLGSLVALQRFAAPSFTLLRVPSLLASIAAVAVAFIAARRLGPRAGCIAALFTAALPVNVAYARFGWDPSHSVVVGLGAMGLAVAGRPIACAALYALALAVHPTNLFLAPALLAASLGSRRESHDTRNALRHTATLAALVCAATAILAVSTSGASEQVGGVGQRVLNPERWAKFASLYARFLDGDAVYEFIVGEARGAVGAWVNALTLGLCALTLAAGFRALRQRAHRDAGIIAGWAASVLAFFVIAGVDAIRAHSERYAMGLVAPTAFAATVALRGWLRPGRDLAAALVLAALALGGFATHYLVPLETSGSDSHRTFWSGDDEPKRRALAMIRGDLRPGVRARVVAEDWWVHWPIAYLANNSDIEVFEENPPATPPPPGGTYWVAFADGARDRALGARGAPRFTVATRGRPGALRVYWTP